MVTKAISILALFASSALLYLALMDSNLAVAVRAEAARDTVVQQQLLASVVQIEMFAESWVEDGQEHALVIHGLGTLVEHGSHCFIITHNHWSVPLGELERVELRNVVGEPLLVLDTAAFLTLVRYQDWGTMILSAPPLAGVVPAQVGHSVALAPGETVWLASQDAGTPGAIGLATARAQRITARPAPGLLELRGSDAPVVAGDSGAGVWHEGKLVGNLWAITEEMARPTWRQWLGGGPEWQQTGEIFVALQPLGGVFEMSASDLSPDSANAPDDEHGPRRHAP